MEKGLRTGGQGLGGESCGPYEERAPTQTNGRLSSQSIKHHSLPSFLDYRGRSKKSLGEAGWTRALSLFFALFLTLSLSFLNSAARKLNLNFSGHPEWETMKMPVNADQLRQQSLVNISRAQPGWTSLVTCHLRFLHSEN